MWNDAEFSVVFVTDDMIRRYNRDYRGFDKPTDVLSFSGRGRLSWRYSHIIRNCI